MVSSKDLNFFIIALLVWLSLETAAGQVSSAPPKVINRTVGSDVVLSWCVPNRVDGLTPRVVTFYLKLPTDQAIDKRAIAVVGSSNIKILPSTSLHKSLFLPSQINVTVTNCTIGTSATNYSLFIRNLTITQGRIFKINANYISKILGDDNETQLMIQEPPYNIYITPSTVTVREGDNAKILCNASGTPNPVLWWLNKEKDVVGKGNAILSLKNIRREEQGEYTCIAENDAGRNNKTVVINVAFLDLECSVENRNMTPYLLIEKNDYPPVDCKPKCVNKMLSTKRTYTNLFTANNGYFTKTCNVTSVYEHELDGDCVYSVTYFTFFSYKTYRLIPFFHPYILIKDTSKFIDSATGIINRDEFKKAKCNKSGRIYSQKNYLVVAFILVISIF